MIRVACVVMGFMGVLVVLLDIVVMTGGVS
jgi:hypothetical protein